MEVREHLLGVVSLLPPCQSGLNASDLVECLSRLSHLTYSCVVIVLKLFLYYVYGGLPMCTYVRRAYAEPAEARSGCRIPWSSQGLLHLQLSWVVISNGYILDTGLNNMYLHCTFNIVLFILIFFVDLNDT